MTQSQLHQWFATFGLKWKEGELDKLKLFEDGVHLARVALNKIELDEALVAFGFTKKARRMVAIKRINTKLEMQAKGEPYPEPEESVTGVKRGATESVDQLREQTIEETIQNTVQNNVDVNSNKQEEEVQDMMAAHDLVSTMNINNMPEQNNNINLPVQKTKETEMEELMRLSKEADELKNRVMQNIENLTIGIKEKGDDNDMDMQMALLSQMGNFTNQMAENLGKKNDEDQDMDSQE